MATITIRNLDEQVKRKLQVRAAQNGRSMEAEARQLLIEATDRGSGSKPTYGLGTEIHKLFAAMGGVELSIPERGRSSRKLPTFD